MPLARCLSCARAESIPKPMATGKQRMTITAEQTRHETVLSVTHFNYLGAVRPGYLYGKIGRLICLMEELLRAQASQRGG